MAFEENSIVRVVLIYYKIFVIYLTLMTDQPSFILVSDLPSSTFAPKLINPNVNILNRFGSRLYNSSVWVNPSQRASLPRPDSQ